MRLTAALILVGTAYAPPGGTAYATPTTVRPHRVPLNVSTITSADGPWFDYWRAVGGDAKAWDQMDDHERARGPGVRRVDATARSSLETTTPRRARRRGPAVGARSGRDARAGGSASR